MSIGILALVTMALWIVQIYELIKPEEKQNNRKIILLTSIGCLLTIILTVNQIQDFLG